VLCHQLESSIATVPGRIMAQPCSPTKRVYAIVSSASSLRRTMSDSLGHAKVLLVKVLVVPIEIVGSSARAGNAGVVIMATRIPAAIFPVCFVLMSAQRSGHGLFPRGFWVSPVPQDHRDGDSIGRHLFDRALDRFPDHRRAGVCRKASTNDMEHKHDWLLRPGSLLGKKFAKTYILVKLSDRIADGHRPVDTCDDTANRSIFRTIAESRIDQIRSSHHG
jgi:hypothetical protein